MLILSNDEELEIIRKRRLMELRSQLNQEQERIQAQQQLETQKQVLMRRILTPEARRRITNLKIVKPEFAGQIELELIQLAQQGRISLPITDEQLKQILLRVQSQHREIKIRRV